MSFHRNSILFAAAMCCVSMFGQTVSSSLVGTVLDPANAVVPNAPVTLTDQDTGRVSTTTTDGWGGFRFLNLSPGTFSVSVQMTRFKSRTQKKVTVSANGTGDGGESKPATG